MTARATGKVKFFKDDRGFGFLVVDGTNEEVFVHRREIPRSMRFLQENERVSFGLEDSEKGNGKKAVKVELIK